MAEGCSVLTSDEDFLTCTLCSELFTNPRALPCLHSFCYKCLSVLLGKNYSSSNTYNNNQMLRCPLCEEDHPIPSNGASGFRQDFRMKALTDKLKSSKEEKAETEICRRHPEFNLDYYCTDLRCEMAICKICKVCWTSEHQNHVVIPVGGNCGPGKSELRTCKDLLSANIKEINTTKETIAKSTDEVNGRVLRKFKKSHEILDTFKDKFMKAIEQRREKEMDKLESELAS